MNMSRLVSFMPLWFSKHVLLQAQQFTFLQQLGKDPALQMGACGVLEPVQKVSCVAPTGDRCVWHPREGWEEQNTTRTIWGFPLLQHTHTHTCALQSLCKKICTLITTKAIKTSGFMVLLFFIGPAFISRLLCQYSGKGEATYSFILFLFWHFCDDQWPVVFVSTSDSVPSARSPLHVTVQICEGDASLSGRKDTRQQPTGWEIWLSDTHTHTFPICVAKERRWSSL